jgi:hypothetical protein
MYHKIHYFFQEIYLKKNTTNNYQIIFVLALKQYNAV